MPDKFDERLRLINEVTEHAQLLGLPVFGYDDSGKTYELRVAKRDSKFKKKNQITVPETCKALCIAGLYPEKVWRLDYGWVQLPAFVTTENAKKTESDRLRRGRADRRAAQHAELDWTGSDAA